MGNQQGREYSNLNEVDAMFGLTAYHEFSCGCVLVKTHTEKEQNEMYGRIAHCEYHEVKN